MAFRWFVILSLLMALARPSTGQEADGDIPAGGGGSRVDRVVLSGQKAFKEKEILEASGLLPQKKAHLFKKSLELNEEEVAERLAEVVLYYQRRGYFEATAQMGEVAEGQASVRIVEGEPSRVGSVRVEVDPEGSWGPVRPEELSKKLPLRVGQPFTVENYEAAADDAGRAWRDAGFPFAAAETEALVDQSTHLVDILIRVRPGEPAAVGDIRFEGTEGLKEVTLRRALSITTGEPWRQLDADKSVEALYRLGLFEGVFILPQPGEVAEGKVAVVVRVIQGSAHRMRAGVGYGEEDGARIRLGWETARLWGRALTFGVDAKISQLESSGLVFLRRPYCPNRDTTIVADAFLGKREEIDYSYRATKARLGFDRKVGKRWEWSAYATAEKLLDISPSAALLVALPPEALDLSILTSISVSATRNATDTPLSPTRGTIVSAYAEPTLVDTGGRSFAKFLLEGRAFFQPVAPVVLALRLKLGAILTGGDPDDIPISRRFYAGGSMSVRGYRYNGLGPLADNGALLGGNGLVEASAEARFPVRGDLLGLVFLDAGNAIADPLDLSHVRLYAGAGFGVRYATPVGPIGLDLGFKLRKDPRDSSPWMIHVFVGYAF